MNPFQRTRQDHSKENAEDYVELIDVLISETGRARAVDLADRLGVSQVTVTKTVQRLHREGLVIARPYKSVTLTDEGRRVASLAKERHELVLAFLIRVGVNPETAEVDAEGIEHHVSAETLEAMKKSLTF